MKASASETRVLKLRAGLPVNALNFELKLALLSERTRKRVLKTFRFPIRIVDNI